jgi:tetratricopeptide (TPR) repeat protein
MTSGGLITLKHLQILSMVFSSKNFFGSLLGVCLGAVLITASLFFSPQPAVEKRALIAPPPHLEYFSFGFQAIIADNLWIRSIQDFDFCETPVAKLRCKDNSWLYQMLDAITNLSPDYLAAYADGGISLSVIVNDSKGASKIFDKGVKVFPKDFPLLYRAGLHAYYDEKDKAKAADLFLKAARVQGLDGTWLYSLATRLYADSGQKDVALQLYNQMEKEGLDEVILKRMREKLGLPDAK